MNLPHNARQEAAHVFTPREGGRKKPRCKWLVLFLLCLSKVQFDTLHWNTPIGILRQGEEDFFPKKCPAQVLCWVRVVNSWIPPVGQPCLPAPRLPTLSCWPKRRCALEHISFCPSSQQESFLPQTYEPKEGVQGHLFLLKPHPLSWNIVCNPTRRFSIILEYGWLWWGENMKKEWMISCMQ